MSIEIWKFPLTITSESITIIMPALAEILCMQQQHNSWCMWAKVNTEAKTEARKFIVRGTGHPLTGAEGEYIGTIQLNSGDLIFHIFEEIDRSLM